MAESNQVQVERGAEIEECEEVVPGLGTYPPNPTLRNRLPLFPSARLLIEKCTFSPTA